MTDLRTRLQTLLNDEYAIERELGGGGMSRVFVATERKLGRRVVIKVLSPELAATLSTGRLRAQDPAGGLAAAGEHRAGALGG